MTRKKRNESMNIKTLGLAFCLFSSSPLVHAASFEVKDIRLEGLQRVSSDTVYNALPFGANQEVSDEALTQAGQALYQTGLFDDIQFERDGNALIIKVKEHPVIAKIKLTGNTQIKSKDLLKGLGKSGIQEGQVLQRSTLDQVQSELLQLYQGQGRYNAVIKTQVKDVGSGRAEVDIAINEGSVARIQQINFVGNHYFSDQQLREKLELNDKPGWFFGFFSHDKYSQQAFSADLDRLRNFYLDRGYADFDIASTQVSISPDKSSIFITISVSEGDQYKIDDIAFAGKLAMSEEKARSYITAKKGEVFNQAVLTASADALRQTLGAQGYTFAKVTPVPQVDSSHDTVKVIFTVDPGERAYVRRISFSGNTTTQDEVLRREMRQMEGAPASTDAIKESQQRLERLGFFSQVNVETKPVPGRKDQIDVHYRVVEQASGSIAASIGYAPSDGIIYGAALSQSNFLGTGNMVNFNAQKSKYYTNLSVGYTNPYWTLSGISRGYNVYYRKLDYKDAKISSYSSNAVGGGINFGYPISDLSRLNFGLSAENLRLNTYSNTPWEIYQYVKDEGDRFNSYRLASSWTRNDLNRGIMPTSGSYQQLAVDATGPGSDAQFYRLRLSLKKFFEINPEWALKFSTDLGYANHYGNTKEFPFFENFFAGGLGSVRGFSGNTLGPRTTARGDNGDTDTLGGNVLVQGTAELFFPLPFIEDHQQLQSSFFIDTGNTYLTSCYPIPPDQKSSCKSGIDLGNLRYSIGVGLSWLTPVGPLTFSIAKPLNKKPGDEAQIFQVSLGQVF